MIQSESNFQELFGVNFDTFSNKRFMFSKYTFLKLLLVKISYKNVNCYRYNRSQHERLPEIC